MRMRTSTGMWVGVSLVVLRPRLIMGRRVGELRLRITAARLTIELQARGRLSQTRLERMRGNVRYSLRCWCYYSVPWVYPWASPSYTQQTIVRAYAVVKAVGARWAVAERVGEE